MFNLDPVNPQVKPAFKDATSAANWVRQLQLTNLTLAHSTLRTQIDTFNLFPVRGKERLQALESLRETVAGVQTDYAKRLLGKKLPLAEDELTTLLMLSSLWMSMFNSYLRCLQDCEAGDSSLNADAALLCQRCMLYCGLQLNEFLHVGYTPDANSWKRLHALYEHIEKLGFEKQNVVDKLSASGTPISARTVYVKTLLLDRARLSGLSRRSYWQVVDAWLDSWGDSFTVERTCSMTREDAPPLAIDLDSSRGIVPIQYATSNPGMRFLAMVPVSKQIRIKTILLQQGSSPEQLGLGKIINAKDCIDLLNKLHQHWCEFRKESLADFSHDAPQMHMSVGIENIYTHIAGKPFRPPSDISRVEKTRQTQIETFGRVLEQTSPRVMAPVDETGFEAEVWITEDDGLLHGRFLRKSGSERLGLNQVVCLLKPGTGSYKLGVVTLVSVTARGELFVALRYLPGAPQALVMRGSACGSLLSGASPALVLPEIAKLKIPASMVIERDWFLPGRKLTLVHSEDQQRAIALGISVEKGHDFERVSYQAAD